MQQQGWRRVAKQCLDRAVAASALATLSPLLLGAGVAIWSTMGRPVLFRQRRPGFKGRPFSIIKFRTMGEGRDGEGRLLPDSQRLTRVGRWLRATSVDELPQLWNVLRGELSLVGPRPLLMQYLARYDDEQARRHDVLPGITGWAQIHGRNTVDWDERFRLDTWYVDHWSLALDVKILAMTARSVLRREGINSEGHATMYEFMGSGSSEQSQRTNGAQGSVSG